MSDVTIIGGGLTGSVLATLLARRNVDVTLVDPHEKYPECFKAEKLEPDQWQLLQKHDLLKVVQPVCEPIDNVSVGSKGCTYGEVVVRQYGYLYHNLVNAIRQNIPGIVDIVRQPAIQVTSDNDSQSVELADGSSISSRLVIMANGGFGRLHNQLGLEKKLVSRQHSFHFGFNIECKWGDFGFDSLTYHATEKRSGVDYLTLFRIPDGMRGNLFTYWRPNSPIVKRFSSNPVDTLLDAMPGLESVLGEFAIPSSIERHCIDLYVAEKTGLPGVVCAGDAFQSVCPATGTGLSKVLTDSDVLADKICDDWLITPGMGVEKTSSYYQDGRKLKQDRLSLRSALQRRKLAIDVSDFRFYFERIMHTWRMQRDCSR